MVKTKKITENVEGLLINGKIYISLDDVNKSIQYEINKVKSKLLTDTSSGKALNNLDKNIRKELTERFNKLIDEMDFLLRPYEIEEIRLWKGRELDKWREHRFFDDVETIKKFEIMKKILKNKLSEEGIPPKPKDLG